MELTGFSVAKYYRPQSRDETLVKSGSVFMLYHKEMEAYLTAEGLLDHSINEGVHLKLISVDNFSEKAILGPQNISYCWQIEPEESIIRGGSIRWDQQVRLRHVTTSQYLSIDNELRVTLARDSDPTTVFQLHSVLKESGEIAFESYARIQHVLTGYWLHATKDELHVVQYQCGPNEDKSFLYIDRDTSKLRKILATEDSHYQNAFTIRIVDEQLITACNFVLGMAPFLTRLIKNVSV